MNDPLSVEPLPPSGDPNAARAIALNKVKLPGLFLIIHGALSAMLTLTQILSLGSKSNEQLKPSLERLRHLVDPSMFELVMKWVEILQGPAFVISQIIFGLLLCGLVIAGAVMMMQLKTYPLALAAAILAIIPCCTGCYCIGIPVGIWSLFVLLDDNVKSQFA